MDTGCIHDVPWLVGRLGAELARLVLTESFDLADPQPGDSGRHGAARRHLHLTNPDSPSSTVAIVRDRGQIVDYLALSDSPIVLRKDRPHHRDRPPATQHPRWVLGRQQQTAGGQGSPHRLNSAQQSRLLRTVHRRRITPGRAARTPMGRVDPTPRRRRLAAARLGYQGACCRRDIGDAVAWSMCPECRDRRWTG